MKLAGILLAYALAVGFLFSTLAGGVMWLVQPGAAVSQEARPAPIPARIADSSERSSSGPSIAPGSDPRPPAFETAIASVLSCTPAIGAWTTGSSIPKSCCNVMSLATILRQHVTRSARLVPADAAGCAPM